MVAAVFGSWGPAIHVGKLVADGVSQAMHALCAAQTDREMVATVGCFGEMRAIEGQISAPAHWQGRGAHLARYDGERFARIFDLWR